MAVKTKKVKAKKPMKAVALKAKEPSTKPKRRACIVIWKSTKNKKFYFHLVASNGKITLDNGQGYSRRVDMIKTIESVIEIFKSGRYYIQEES